MDVSCPRPYMHRSLHVKSVERKKIRHYMLDSTAFSKSALAKTKVLTLRVGIEVSKD